jgi:hypothetical protein
MPQNKNPFLKKLATLASRDAQFYHFLQKNSLFCKINIIFLAKHYNLKKLIWTYFFSILCHKQNPTQT